MVCMCSCKVVAYSRYSLYVRPSLCHYPLYVSRIVVQLSRLFKRVFSNMNKI
jgi:hypothetical protein